MGIQILNGERWLKVVGGGMAVFCGLVGTLVTVAVVILLIGEANFQWTGKPMAWRVGQPGSPVSAYASGKVSCPPRVTRCGAAHKPEAKHYVPAMLGQLALQAPLAALAYGLFQASAGFVGVARGQSLARCTTGRLVRFAVAGLSFVLLAPQAGRIGAFVADGSRKLISLATGDRSYQVSVYTVGFENVTSLLTMVYALALTIIAVILVKASTIADDHAQIV